MYPLMLLFQTSLSEPLLLPPGHKPPPELPGPPSPTLSAAASRAFSWGKEGDGEWPAQRTNSLTTNASGPGDVGTWGQLPGDGLGAEQGRIAAPAPLAQLSRNQGRP